MSFKHLLTKNVQRVIALDRHALAYALLLLHQLVIVEVLATLQALLLVLVPSLHHYPLD